MPPAARAWLRDESALLRDGATESEITHAIEVLTDRHTAWAAPRGYLVDGHEVTIDWAFATELAEPTEPSFLTDPDKPITSMEFTSVRVTRVTLTAQLLEDMSGEWPAVRAALAEDGLLPALQRASERPAALPRAPEPPQPLVGAEFHMGTTPPAHPVTGDMWFDSASSKTHVWTGSEWTAFAPSHTAVDRFREALSNP